MVPAHQSGFLLQIEAKKQYICRRVHKIHEKYVELSSEIGLEPRYAGGEA